MIARHSHEAVDHSLAVCVPVPVPVPVLVLVALVSSTGMYQYECCVGVFSWLICLYSVDRLHGIFIEKNKTSRIPDRPWDSFSCGCSCCSAQFLDRPAANPIWDDSAPILHDQTNPSASAGVDSKDWTRDTGFKRRSLYSSPLSVSQSAFPFKCVVSAAMLPGARRQTGDATGDATGTAIWDHLEKPVSRARYAIVGL